MDDEKRKLLFFLVCIPVRLALAFASYKYSTSYPRLSAFLGLLVAIGFARQHFAGDNKGGFGGEVTWNRLVHASFFLAFAVSSIMKGPSYAILLANVAYGLFTHASRWLV